MLIPEFAPQSGILLCWPHTETDWHDSLDTIETVYIELVRTITRFQPVIIVCHDRQLQKHIRYVLNEAAVPDRHIHLVIAASNDTWIRDYGPLTISRGGHTVLLDFEFDGWGEKHPAALDNRITQQLVQSGLFGNTGCEQHSLVLEGGSIETDGNGSLLTTSRCLLDSGRNPGYDRDSLASLFEQLLGIRQVLWLEHGALSGDDTDSHIDMLARFCSPRCIVYTRCSDPNDEDYAGLLAMEQQLKTFRDIKGRPYRCTPLPLPAPIVDHQGKRLPASYANFLILDKTVLAPVYNVPEDTRAIDTLAGCFPGREILPVNCLPLVQQAGSLHCATMQLPANVLTQ